jgi:hypothetical protein
VPLFDINPTADPNVQDVIRLHQINLEAQVGFEAEKDRLQAERGRIRQKRKQNFQFPAFQETAASQTTSPTIRYDDETLYNKNVLEVIGRRPRGRPSKAKVEKRRADLAAAQLEFENRSP